MKLVSRSNNLISLYFTLPKTDKGMKGQRDANGVSNTKTKLRIFSFHQSIETLEKLSIPSYDPAATKALPRIQNNLANSLTISRPRHSATSSASPAAAGTGVATTATASIADDGDVVDAVMNSPPIVQLDYRCNSSSSTAATSLSSAHNQMEPESNSEDSSLSDGDRTLVGDVSPMLSASNSPACSDQHLSSPEDHMKINGDAYGDDDTDMLDVQQNKKYFFKAVYYEEPVIGGSENNEEDGIRRVLSVLVDNTMNIAHLKRVLEPYIKVPMEYFKIFRHNASQTEVECTRLTEDLRSFTYVFKANEMHLRFVCF